MLITEQRRWQNTSVREGGTEGRERELACVRETGVTARNNQYNL